MNFFGNNTGVAMIVRSLGIDPNVLMQKANEFEVFARKLGAELFKKVSSVDARLGAMQEQLNRMESLLVMTSNNALIASQSAVLPAGDGWAPVVSSAEPEEKYVPQEVS